MFNKVPVNNRIRSREVRVINEKGEQLGVMSLEKALQISRERNLDLVQVTGKVDPPICKIMEYGKYLYSQEKKAKKAKKSGEVKGIRIGFNTSLHDLETKANAAEKFLKKNNKVKIEMRLRGREKALKGHAREKLNEFLEMIKEKIVFKVDKDFKKHPGRLTIIITKE